MTVIYENNEQIVIEIKKLMLEKKISQREIADKMGIKPQGLTKILNKKNFGFEDAEKLLNAMGYDLTIGFQKKPLYNQDSIHEKAVAHQQSDLLTQLENLPTKASSTPIEEEPPHESLEAKLNRLRSEHASNITNSGN